MQASKKHYCVHPVASQSPSLEDECEQMLGDGGCRFFLGAHQLDTLHSTSLRVRGTHNRRLTGNSSTLRTQAALVSPHLAIHLVPSAQLTLRSTASITAQVHDIEDLVAEGRRRKACPYFASTQLAQDAELVFCPYKSVLLSHPGPAQHHGAPLHLLDAGNHACLIGCTFRGRVRVVGKTASTSCYPRAATWCTQ